MEVRIMLLTLALLAAQTPVARDTCLEHARLFAKHDRATLEANIIVARFFSSYLLESSCGEDGGYVAKFGSEFRRHRRTTLFVYNDLDAVTNPRNDDVSKLIHLRRLRQELGEPAFHKGEVPPPYPPKYEKPFKTWLAKKFEAGHKTPEAVDRAAGHEVDKRRERALQERAAEAAKEKEAYRRLHPPYPSGF
jgi:hypothetical protein